MPISRQARIPRTAISPRLAIKIFLNIDCSRRRASLHRAQGRARFCWIITDLLALAGATLLGVHHTPESDGSGTVETRGHQQVLAVLVQLVRLRKIPDRSLRAVVAAAPQNRRARMVILVLVRPLPDIADEIPNAAGTLALGSQARIGRRAQGASLFRRRYSACIPRVTPRIQSSVRTLGSVLPLPLVRQTLACPGRIGARIFD